jgi:stage II sporulation protein P
MKRIFLLCVSAIIVTTLWTVLSTDGMSVTTRPLLQFFDHIDTGEISREDLLAERFFTMVDEDGREVMVTGRKIHVGDEYITSDNRLYRVYRVRDRIAHARFIREVGAVFAEEPSGVFVMLQQWLGGGTQTVQTEQEEEEAPDENAEEPAEDEEEGLEPEDEPRGIIGIYHTHNAESYVPTDGTDSINGVGGIHNVGTSFTAALEEKGVTVLYDETLHLPHDRGAYRRSRVTVEGLLEEGPDVLFDVHRDAAPMNVYAAKVDDEWVTQVQFVVGRQNPNMTVNRQFALDLKNTADEVHPGLIKGIFMARGDYNQDMAPTNLLLEVGAHQNTRGAAEQGIALFADVVSVHFYGPEGEALNGEQAAPAPGQQPQTPGARIQPATRTAARSMLTMLLMTAAIGVSFVVLNSRSMDDVRFKLLPYMEKLRPYTEKPNRFLASWQEKIYAAGAVTWKKTRLVLESGEQIRTPMQGKIHTTGVSAWNKTRVLLAEGDRFLIPIQEKIREFALTVKKRVQLFGNRRKLR